MPSKTNVRLTVRGVDQTRAMFARVRANVALMASQVKAAAIGAAGGAAAIGAAIRASANQFSVLSDRAAQAGMAASQLNALVSGLGIAGAKGANLETVADALARMTKATGATGTEGLRETLASVAALGDEGARVQELSRIFGRTFGPGLAALVREGPDKARAALDDMIAAGPRLSDSLVRSGDAIADGMGAAWANVRTGWHESVVSMGAAFADYVGKPQRQFWADLGAYVRYGVQVAFRCVGMFAQNIVAVLSNFRTLWRATFDNIGEMLARNLLKAWNQVVAWGKNVAASFVWVKDMIDAAFSDRTFADAQAKFNAATDAANALRDERNAAVDAMLGDASWANIAEAFKRAGVTLEVDTADLKSGLADDLERNASGILDRLNDLSGSLGSAVADSVGKSLGPVQNARAVLASSYEAFKIASQSGRGGTPAERATIDTAKNTAAVARNTAAAARFLERFGASMSEAERLYVLA